MCVGIRLCVCACSVGVAAGLSYCSAFDVMVRAHFCADFSLASTALSPALGLPQVGGGQETRNNVFCPPPSLSPSGVNRPLCMGLLPSLSLSRSLGLSVSFNPTTLTVHKQIGFNVVVGGFFAVKRVAESIPLDMWIKQSDAVSFCEGL